MEQEKSERDKAWDMWIAIYPYTIIIPYGYRKPLKFVPFSEFYKKIKTKPINTKLTKADIIKKAEDIKQLDRQNNNNKQI